MAVVLVLGWLAVVGGVAGVVAATTGQDVLVAGLIAVRGIFRIYDTIPPNPGLQQGYWFAIEEAIIDPLGAPLNAN